MSAYLEAVEASDPAVREAKLAEHARRIREHARLLAQKAYWESFEPTPDFVALFLPGEAFFAAAVQSDPELIEFCAERRIVLAAPTTLIALLKAVAYAWREDSLHRNAAEIATLARRFLTALEEWRVPFDDLGRRLEQVRVAYQDTTKRLNSDLGPLAGRLRDLGGSSEGT
jgi:DNA recombination protein RmuC